MNARFVSRSIASLAALAAVVTVTACGDKTENAVDKGMSRDSVLSVLAKNSPGSGSQRFDSLPSVYKHSTYLVDGKHIEVMYYDQQNRRPTAKDSVPLRDLTPIVMVDSKVVGKGWPVWDSVATAHKIEVAKKP